MFYELASAFAGLVFILTAQFIVGDALGLLGEPFGKIGPMINGIANRQVHADAYRTLFTNTDGLRAVSARGNSR
jgi:hypothetical protein